MELSGELAADAAVHFLLGAAVAEDPRRSCPAAGALVDGHEVDHPRSLHRFEWLVGDRGRDGTRRTLPVDAYYPDYGLVIEYRERQHDEPVAHFDKPHVKTVSGVHRGKQRRIYDHRRDIEIPAQRLRLVVVTPGDLVSSRRGRLLRDRERDLVALRFILDAPRP